MLPGLRSSIITLLTELRWHIHAVWYLEVGGVVPSEDSLKRVDLILAEEGSSQGGRAGCLMFKLLVRAMQIGNRNGHFIVEISRLSLLVVKQISAN